MAIQKGGQNCSITSFALNFQTLMAQILAYTKKSLAKLQEFLKSKYKKFINMFKSTYVKDQKGLPATLRPYVIDALLNQIGRDLLMQWQTQIHIPQFS